MIKVISFDIGGTILLTKSISQYNLKALTELVNKPYEEVRNTYKNIFQKKKGTLEELVFDFTTTLNIINNQEIINFFKEKFSFKNNVTEYNKNIISLIKKLKEMGFKIILFSNSCCLLVNDLSDEILNNVDVIYYSYDLGYTKSDSMSYKIIEKKMNVLPNEILHIGDTLKSDYIKPIENGWNALYYGKTDDKNINNIENLEEILDIVSGDLWIEYSRKNKIGYKK